MQSMLDETDPLRNSNAANIYLNNYILFTNEILKGPLLTMTLCAPNQKQDRNNLGQNGLSDNTKVEFWHHEESWLAMGLYLLLTLFSLVSNVIALEENLSNV